MSTMFGDYSRVTIIILFNRFSSSAEKCKLLVYSFKFISNAVCRLLYYMWMERGVEVDR